MKRLIFIFLILLSLPSFASKYYVKNGGNNSNTGLSDDQAWATIAKVNGFTFAAGDTIALKKGSMWREKLIVPRSGTAGNYMVITNYGTGTNPQLLGSSVSSAWTNTSGNIWQSNSTFAGDPSAYSTLFFCEPTDTIWGVYKSNTGSLAAKYDWTYSSSRVYVYSTSDPATAFSNVEVPQLQFCLDLGDKDYIEVNGLDFHFATWGGICQHTTTMVNTGFIMRNCFSSWFGGINGYGYGIFINNIHHTLIEHNTFHDAGRRGISINNGCNTDIDDIIVQNNVFYNGWHTTGPDIETGTSTSGDFTNVIVRNNLIWDVPNKISPYAISMWIQGPHGGTGQIRGIKIYNNIIKYQSGRGIALEDIDGAEIYNNTFYGDNTNNTTDMYQFFTNDGSTDINVKNNIFYTQLTTDVVAQMVTYGVSNAQVDADYNLYYAPNNVVPIVYSGSAYHMNDIALIRSTFGWEINSPTPANPNFVSTTDYHVQEGSPAIDNALPIDYITTDFYGNARSATTPTIGAIEYDASPAVLVTSITISAVGSATTISTEGGTLQMYTNVEPDNASDTTKTWSVINGTGSATIAQTGIVTAVTDGTVTVRATANDASGVYDDYALTISNQDIPPTEPESKSIRIIKENGKFIKHNGKFIK